MRWSTTPSCQFTEAEICGSVCVTTPALHRYGLRLGISAGEALPKVLDSMVVDLEYLGRDCYMPLDDTMRAKLADAIKTALSPRFVPNEIFQVAEIPRTLSGKKQELVRGAGQVASVSAQRSRKLKPATSVVLARGESE